MDYKVKVFGKSCDLPARTLAVDEQMEAIRDLETDYRLRKLSRRECVEKMYALAEALLPEVLPPLEDVDTNELTNACADICAAYAAPVRKARTAAQMEELRETLARPEMQKALAALQAMHKK